MIQLALVLAVLAQTGKSDDKYKYPPFTVTITARDLNVPDVERQAFERGLKQLERYAKQISCEKIPGDPEGYKIWVFEVAGNLKFDPTPFLAAFMNIKTRKYELALTGTLTQEAQTKKMFLTTFTGKTKVKLVNKPKGAFDNPDEKSKDMVGEVGKQFADGKLHFRMSGEIYNHGGTLCIILASYDETDPPPPKEDKGKK